MTKSLILWGTGLACALGGAMAGNAVGSTPVTDRSTIEMLYQTHQTASAERPAERTPPNHYPLVTRDGVVEVANLSVRGLFSQPRYRQIDFGAIDANADLDEPGRGIDDAVPAPPPAAEPAHATTPAVQLAAGETEPHLDGEAKIIDVQATLAMR